METAAGCGIERLPEELLTAIISLTSPLDACRAAAVSRAFRAAADSDVVWSCFLPGPSFELRPCTPWRKALFLHLSGKPLLLPLPGTLMAMWLDRVTGAKCYSLPARALQISLGDTPPHWRWINVVFCNEIGTIRIAEAAELLHVTSLEIRGKIHSRMLSKNCTYVAYMLFRIADTGSYGLDYPFQEASLSFGGSESTRRACLHGYVDNGDGAGKVPRKHVTQYNMGGPISIIPIGEDVTLPSNIGDGWMALQFGEFYNEGDTGDVSMSLTGTNIPYPKRGLIVLGFHITVKKQCQWS